MGDEGWTHKGYQWANDLENVLQALFPYHFFVWNTFAQGEIAQPKEFDVWIIGLVTLSDSRVS